MPVNHTTDGLKAGTCWTCRLRRKWCDRVLPVCGTCAELGIRCDRNPTRPDWLDGSSRQKSMAERFKVEIRERAAARRARLRQHQLGEVESSDRMEQREEPDQPSRPTQPAPDGQPDDHERPQTISPATAGSSLSVADFPAPFPNLGAFFSASRLPDSSDAVDSDAVLSLPTNAWEMDFMMIYMDHVFPSLFPFYRPSVINTSRAWLLTFLRRHSAVFHSVLSLSAYFFAAALKDAFPTRHAECKRTVWAQVVKQADACYEAIQRDLAELGQRSEEASLLERARVMENIVQLLIFEVFVGSSAGWRVHLAPALSLFEGIYAQYSMPEKPGLLGVLKEMPWDSKTDIYQTMDRFAWNPDQAAFRFFTAVLIYVDIIASTTGPVEVGGQPGRSGPRLSALHETVLGEIGPGDNVSGPLDLSAFVGCQNWALRAVGQIAALDGWKKAARGAGSLSVLELVERAGKISQSLDEGLARLDAAAAAAATPTLKNESAQGGGGGGIGRLLGPPNGDIRDPAGPGPGLAADPTRIWTLAARLYLAVVVSGWQPANAEVRRDVAGLIALLRDMRGSAPQLRALAWPVCVAGCLAAQGSEEQAVQALLAGLGEVGTGHGISEAGRIIEAVWTLRADADLEAWDFEACFRVLGAPVLLI